MTTYEYRDLQREVRQHEHITAELMLSLIAKHTSLEATLAKHDVHVDEVLGVCRSAEQSSTSGASTIEQLGGLYPRLARTMESNQSPMPTDGNFVLRCTPLAAELVVLSMNPQFAQEMEEHKRAGTRLDDPAFYRHDVVRPMNDYIAATLESLGRYASPTVAQKLKLVAQELFP